MSAQTGNPRKARSAVLQLSQALGHQAADKRIDILRRIGDAGSISEAARGAAVSYKAAWQAIETLSNLAGAPLVERAVGGTGGGGARLTDAGRRVLEAADRLDAARAQVLSALESGSRARAPMPGIAALGLRTSMRNQIPCRVAAIEPGDTAARVVLELPDSSRLRARVTVESVELLGLHPGQPVLALFKATAVVIAAHLAAAPGRNLLEGRIARVARASSAGELSLRLASGAQVVGFAGSGHGLRARQRAMACIDESGVVIAVSA